jgi:DNA-binding NtrC family response regulator
MDPTQTSGDADIIPNGTSHFEDAEFALTPEQIAAHQRQLAHHRKAMAQAGNRARLHALIVEDQLFSRNLLYQVLNQSCAVSSCATALDGWKIYLREMPDVAFLDIELPGASGHVLAEKIKHIDPNAYIVMVTGNQDVNNIQMAKINHVDGFIVKPFNKQKIDDCISRYMQSRKSSNSGHAA